MFISPETISPLTTYDLPEPWNLGGCTWNRRCWDRCGSSSFQRFSVRWRRRCHNRTIDRPSSYSVLAVCAYEWWFGLSLIVWWYQCGFPGKAVCWFQRWNWRRFYMSWSWGFISRGSWRLRGSDWGSCVRSVYLLCFLICSVVNCWCRLTSSWGFATWFSRCRRRRPNWGHWFDWCITGSCRIKGYFTTARWVSLFYGTWKIYLIFIVIDLIV